MVVVELWVHAWQLERRFAHFECESGGQHYLFAPNVLPIGIPYYDLFCGPHAQYSSTRTVLQNYPGAVAHSECGMGMYVCC